MPTLPVWSDLTVLPMTVLPRYECVDATLDLTSAVGAMFYLRTARTGAAALTNGVRAALYREVLGERHIAPFIDMGVSGQAGFQAANVTTVTQDAAAGQKILEVATAFGYAPGHYVFIQDGDAGLTRAEWCRVSRITGISGGDTLYFQDPLIYAHEQGQADVVRNRADVYPPIWMPGGCVARVLFDYGDDLVGDAVIVDCRAQIYESDIHV